MSKRRRQRGWREVRPYSFERVAFYLALAAVVAVVVVTILIARIKREQTSGAPALVSHTQSGTSDDDQE